MVASGTLRNRHPAPAYHFPGPQISRINLSTQYGEPIDSELDPLARSMFQFDLKLLRRVEILDQKEQKDVSSTGGTCSTEVMNRLEKVKDLRRQWKDIQLEEFHINQSYLKDRQIIKFWDKGLNHIQTVLANKKASANQVKTRKDYHEIVYRYNRYACSLYDTLCDVAGEIALEDCVLNLIRARWVMLDDLFDGHLRTFPGDEGVKYSTLRIAPRWSQVLHTMREKNLSSNRIQHPEKIKHKNELAGRFMTSTFVFWSVSAVCISTSLAFFACGYAQSPHARGSTKDADFWFLLQSSTTQVIGFGVSTLIEWQNREHPQWHWIIPTSIAGICAIVAIPLYIAAPTEWSSFLSQIAGLTQIFMICQYFLSDKY